MIVQSRSNKNQVKEEEEEEEGEEEEEEEEILGTNEVIAKFWINVKFLNVSILRITAAGVRPKCL